MGFSVMYSLLPGMSVADAFGWYPAPEMLAREILVRISMPVVGTFFLTVKLQGYGTFTTKVSIISTFLLEMVRFLICSIDG